MNTIGQYYYYVARPVDKENPVIETNWGGEEKKSPYDVISGLNWKKIGIQAPPGTVVVINGDKEITISANGLYELDFMDEGQAIINTFKVEQPKSYILNKTATDTAQTDAITKWNDFLEKIKDIEEATSETDKIAQLYSAINSEEFQALKQSVNTAKKGVYTTEKINIPYIIVDYVAATELV